MEGYVDEVLDYIDENAYIFEEYVNENDIGILLVDNGIKNEQAYIELRDMILASLID